MMYFTPSPLETDPVSVAETPFLNRCYLYTTDNRSDPSLVWGTEVDMSGLQKFLAGYASRGQSLLTTTPILIRALGLALTKHPEFNCRVLGGRIYRFNEVNILVPLQRPSGGPSLGLIRRINQQSYEQIFRTVWSEQQGAVHSTRDCDFSERVFRYLPPFLAQTLLRILLWVSNNVPKPMDRFDRSLRGAPAILNHFGFPGAPPLLSYKPSRFGSHCSLLNVTLGPTTMRPTVIDDQVVARPKASLFVRADHRLVDARQLAAFVRTIVNVLTTPEDYDLCEPQQTAESNPCDSSQSFDLIAPPELKPTHQCA
jgi:hypothetical protein